MTKFLLKLLLFNLMVFSTIISFGQKTPSTSVMKGSQILNSQTNSLQCKKYEFPDYSSAIQPEINNSELALSHQNKKKVMDMETEFSSWNRTTEDFNQDTTTIMFIEDFDATEYGSVYNYLEREIFTEGVCSKLYNMNTSEFDSGIYLFQI